MKKRNLKKICFTICTILTLALSCHITHTKKKIDNIAFFGIPGQHGGGSHPRYIKRCLDLDNTVRVKRVNYPKTWTTIDLGQHQCMSFLEKPLKKDKTNNGVIHATSQGTATAFNYLAIVDKGKKIKALILEAPLVSGNDSIRHVIQDDLPALSKIPFSYYLLPYLAKIRFPWYSPSGIQVIKSIPKIPNNTPIIIIHSKKDPLLPYSGSCALYYGLRAHGNKNAYFISVKGKRHIRILESKPELQKVVQAILKKHNLLDSKKINLKKIDLAQYQPNPDKYKKIYDNLLSKEKWHERAFYGSAIAAAGTTAALSYYAGKKLYSKYVKCSS